jgi:DNA-binding MarR family transcriptional regulator
LSSADPQAPALETYRLEEQVGFHLRRANQRHTSIFAELMTDGLTPTQWAALVKVGEMKTVSQNLLGRETAMDAATIKGVVDRLIKRGFLAARSDPSDARRSLIEITAAGEMAVRNGRAQAAAITEETLKPLSSADRATLIRLLERIS